MITSSELRSKYLKFFTENGHVVIPSASLVPANDPTVLFTTAGMHPLVPYLLGEPHPGGRRLTDVQKCVRTGDIEAIGDDTHLTFFEMLGNWSLGDYGRADAIRWSFEFLTHERWLGLSVDRLGVTCFAGDRDAPRDHESVAIWRSLGMTRIALLGRDDNWWGPAGKTGPCGPDTEIFYWCEASPAPEVIDVRDKRWVEIWNNVFMGYTRTASGAIEPLAHVNVDTGMGLERTLVAINGLSSVYEVDTVEPAYRELQDRVLTDHLRAACFMLGDGVGPSNKDRGYIVRRLLRRCALFAKQRGLSRGWHERGVAAVVGALGADYPEICSPAIAATIEEELARFERTLAQGLKVLAKQRTLDGKIAFDLFQTYGFPFELTLEIAVSNGQVVDRESFLGELEHHRAKSRTTGAFAGGLADHSDEVVRYHTLTHLLQAALRIVLGDQVVQRGSNITRERLRFDFSYGGKPTPEQLERVESIVNGWLARDLVVERRTMTEREARASGAIGAFGEKYGETVSVYAVVDASTLEVLSREFCGGPHVRSSRELAGRFHIVREQSISTGLRRIKAVLEATDR